jgi:ABC-type uncharacterized transport system ATPase subunit
MRDIWGFSYMTFGAILAILVCNAGKAGTIMYRNRKDRKMYKNLVDYLPEFSEALKEQLVSDQFRWGNTWKKRSIEGQELRTKARFDDYFAQFENAGKPIPWLKVAGAALICWVREQSKQQ